MPALVSHSRPRTHDVKIVVVRTAPARADRHTHCAMMNNDGFGTTSPGPDGHTHAVEGCDISVGPDGHTHELSARRCEREHDRSVRHVD